MLVRSKVAKHRHQINKEQLGDRVEIQEEKFKPPLLNLCLELRVVIQLVSMKPQPLWFLPILKAREGSFPGFP